MDTRAPLHCCIHCNRRLAWEQLDTTETPSHLAPRDRTKHRHRISRLAAATGVTARQLWIAYCTRCSDIYFHKCCIPVLSPQRWHHTYYRFFYSDGETPTQDERCWEVLTSWAREESLGGSA